MWMPFKLAIDLLPRHGGYRNPGTAYAPFVPGQRGPHSTFVRPFISKEAGYKNPCPSLLGLHLQLHLSHLHSLSITQALYSACSSPPPSLSSPSSLSPPEPPLRPRPFVELPATGLPSPTLSVTFLTDGPLPLPISSVRTHLFFPSLFPCDRILRADLPICPFSSRGQPERPSPRRSVPGWLPAIRHQLPVRVRCLLRGCTCGFFFPWV
jgi:hypothetical protein